MRHIFNFLPYLYQIQFIIIVQDLRSFFEKSIHNFIKFWECLNKAKWIHHSVVNKQTKKYNLKLIFLCKLSWDFSMKNKCNSIIQNWQMTFQASDFKRNYFLELLDSNCLPIESVYTKNSI